MESERDIRQALRSIPEGRVLNDSAVVPSDHPADPDTVGEQNEANLHLSVDTHSEGFVASSEATAGENLNTGAGVLHTGDDINEASPRDPAAKSAPSVCPSPPSGHCTYNVRTLYVHCTNCTYNVRTVPAGQSWLATPCLLVLLSHPE